MQKKKQPIVYAFIDSQNLNLGVLSQGWRLDFVRFYVFLKEKYKVTKALLFIGNITGNERLYTYLQNAGFIVILKPTLVYKKDGEEQVKGNVDAELVLHSMIEYPNYDKAIVVSGDGDFHCLIEYFVGKNKLEKLIVPNRKFSSLLREYGDFIVNVNLFRGKLEDHKKREAFSRDKTL